MPWAGRDGQVPRVASPPKAVVEAVLTELVSKPPVVDPTDQYKVSMRRRLNQKTAAPQTSEAAGTMSS